MKTRTKKQSKQQAQRMIIEATTSDSSVGAFISLLRPVDREWPLPETDITIPAAGKKAVVN